MSFYTIDSISFSYNKTETLFKDVSFNIEKNQNIGLIGPNGCGKTTLANIMMGILKVQSGEVYLQGKNIKQLSLSDIGKRVGYVFQNPEVQLFCPTVKDQMYFSIRYNKDIEEDQIDEKIKHLLYIFELDKHKDHSPLNLSIGEKQRLALASVLSREVEFLILDEPTTSLDILRINQLEKYLSIIQQKGIGYLIISHDRGFLNKHVDKLLILKSEGVELI
ncbi:ABC transporter ATP-binding protein [Proteiniborus sp.]|uniref:energy-coupling factor ABC transporter ATP-binding protein n=1 Tax=Proteiniborus sp. TaxID=2079015 RepID=UPI00333227F0